VTTNSSGVPQVLTIGRVSVDLYGKEVGVGLDGKQSFAKAVGGSPTNVAIGIARYGHHAAVATGVGDDSLGTFVINELQNFGVSTEFVIRVPGVRTPLVIAGTEDPDAPEFVFYRDAHAPDTQIDHIPAKVGTEVELLWYTGSNFAQEPLRSTLIKLLATRGRKRHTVFDLDYRPSFWSSPEQAHEAIRSGLANATVALGNLAECRVATGLPYDATPNQLADALLSAGVELAIIKGGSQGVLVADATDREFVPAIRVETVCGLGAGDAFGAGVVHGLLSGWNSRDTVIFANAAGAIVASRLLCSDAMPTQAEVLDLLKRNGVNWQR
jgi:5-dehydro-2-deoxygluconokinase